MLKKNKFLKMLISAMFCFAFFAASMLGFAGETLRSASAAEQESTPKIYTELSGTNWSCEDDILTLSGVNWQGVLELSAETEIALENSSINTIVGTDSYALSLNGSVTISGTGRLKLGKQGTAVSSLINFKDGYEISFPGTCLAQLNGDGELIELASPLTQETLENVNYIEITTEGFVEPENPGLEPGQNPGEEPEGGEPSVDEPSVTAVSETVTIKFDALTAGKYNIATMFNFVNCDTLIKQYYFVSADGQTETILPSEDYDISAVGTYNFKVKVSQDGTTTLAECTSVLVVQKTDVTFSLAFGKWEFGEAPTPQITGNIPAGAEISYRYFEDPEHNIEITENNGIPTEVGIYYAVATVAETPTTNGASAEASFEIVRKTISIIWSADNYTYNGQVQEIKAHYILGGESIEIEVTTDKEFKNAQSYIATAVIENLDSNYIPPDNLTNSYTIKKLDITVRIDNKTSTYLEDLRTLTASAPGAVAGEIPYILSTTASKDAMGSYDIVGTSTNENYNISFIKGKYIVKNKITSLTMESWTFGETQKSPQATAYYGAEHIFYTYTSTSGYNSNQIPTEPGRYYVKAEIVLPEEYYCDDAIASFTINKLVVEIPQGDQTTYTYDGQYKVYNLVGQNEFYTVTGAIQLEAGTHKVKVTLNNPAHYKWQGTTEETIEFAFVIERLKIEKPLKDTRVFKYSGFNLVYNISESLNYNVSGNVQSEEGTHVVTIELADKKNTCWSDGSIKDLHYDFVIRGNAITNPNTTNTKGEKLDENPVTIIGSDGNGIDPNVKLNVVVGDADDTALVLDVKSKLGALLKKYDAVHTIYDVTLQKDSVEIQPDGVITMRLIVPEKLRDMGFRLYHIHQNQSGEVTAEEVECSVSSLGFVTIQVDKLSDFVFVYKQNSLKTLIIVFAVLCFVFAASFALLLWLYLKNNSKSKTASIKTLALAPAMFVGGEVVCSIILGVLSAILLAGNVVLLVLLIKRGKKQSKLTETNTKNEEVFSTKQLNDVEADVALKTKRPKKEIVEPKTKKNESKPMKDTASKSKAKSSKTSKATTKNSTEKKEKAEMRSLDFTKKK